MFLEFFALAKLRYRRPDLPRYFRVPGGKIGLWLTVICPVAVGLFAMFAAERNEIIAGSIAVATGPLAFWLCKKFINSRRKVEPDSV
jgi:hypothetical protein